MHQDSEAGWRRRELLGALVAGGGLAALPQAAQAQSYPSKPIKMAVLSPPGANGDLLARLLGRYLESELGQPVIIDNKPGAGGHISHEYAARSAPDGHTILFGANTVFSLAPILFPKLGYDPVNDLAPVGFYYEPMYWIVTNPSLGLKNMDDFVAYAKQKGGVVNYGSAGIGHPMHLYTEQIQAALGTKMTHVPHNGMTQAIMSVMQNDVQFLVTGVADTIGYIKAGKIQVLATTGPLVRDIAPPNTPHLPDRYPELADTGWVGIFVPRKTPADIVAKLSATLNKLAASPAFAKDLALGGNFPLQGSPADVLKRMGVDRVQTAQIAKRIQLVGT